MTLERTLYFNHNSQIVFCLAIAYDIVMYYAQEYQKYYIKCRKKSQIKDQVLYRTQVRSRVLHIVEILEWTPN